MFNKTQDAISELVYHHHYRSIDDISEYDQDRLIKFAIADKDRFEDDDLGLSGDIDIRSILTEYCKGNCDADEALDTLLKVSFSFARKELDCMMDIEATSQIGESDSCSMYEKDQYYYESCNALFGKGRMAA